MTKLSAKMLPVVETHSMSAPSFRPQMTGWRVEYGINISGQIAGVAYTPAGDPHAVRWTGTTPTHLGPLGGTRSEAYAINSSGDVVGISFPVGGSGTTDSFLYTGGTMYDLNSLLISGSGVTNLNVEIYGNSINDLGQIGATGSIAGQDYAPPLTPVGIPEPSTPLLLAIAIAGFLSRRIRSSRIVSLSLSVV